jgi:hypothetical protein
LDRRHYDVRADLLKPPEDQREPDRNHPDLGLPRFARLGRPLQRTNPARHHQLACHIRVGEVVLKKASTSFQIAATGYCLPLLSSQKHLRNFPHWTEELAQAPEHPKVISSVVAAGLC